MGRETILLTLTELGRLVSNLQDSERSIRPNLTFRLFKLFFMFIYVNESQCLCKQ